MKYKKQQWRLGGKIVFGFKICYAASADRFADELMWGKRKDEGVVSQGDKGHFKNHGIAGEVD